MATIKIINCKISGKGPTLLLLHGLGSCGDDWQFQIEALSDHFTLITPDIPSQGSIAELAAACNELLDSPAYVVGLSLGSLIALQLALDYPEKVKKLALISGTCRMKDTNPLLLAIQKIGIKLFSMKTIASAIAWLSLPKKEQAELRLATKERLSVFNKEKYIEFYNKILQFDVKNRLSELRIPTLILAGTRDWLILPSHSATLHAGIRHSTLHLLQDTGHIIPIEQSTECNQQLLSFFH